MPIPPGFGYVVSTGTPVIALGGGAENAFTTITPTEEDIFTVLGLFLSNILPSACKVVQGQINRVPEPRSQDFVTMTVTRRVRLATNVDADADCAFIASISGTTMSDTCVQPGLPWSQRP